MIFSLPPGQTKSGEEIGRLILRGFSIAVSRVEVKACEKKIMYLNRDKSWQSQEKEA
jgi:hypothetical protein